MSYVKKANPVTLAKSKKRNVIERILIVTEGTKTEICYFEWIRNYFNLSHRIQVGVALEITSGKGSDPESVVNTAIELKKNSEKSAEGCFDYVYCVIDRDKHQKTKIENARAKSKAYGIILIISYPCIEYWFILHYSNYKTPYNQIPGKGSIGTACKNQLNKLYPNYDGKLENFFSFISDYIETATDRASTNYHRIEDQDCINPSTMLFILMKHLASLRLLIGTGDPTSPENSKLHKNKLDLLTTEHTELINIFFNHFN